MSSAAEPEPPKPVPNKGVCSALDKNAVWKKWQHHSFQNSPKDIVVLIISDSLLKRDIDFVVASKAGPRVLCPSRSRKKVFSFIELMKGQGQYSIGVLEGLLDSVPMMDIDVNIENFIELF